MVVMLPSPTRITVLYFAAVRDARGTDREELTLPDGVATISDLATLLERLHAGLTGRLSGVRYAINEEFVDERAQLRAGDVVAVIPPVSGG